MMVKPFDSVKPHLIGRTATIVGYSMEGDETTDSVAHICLDVNDGPRVFIQAVDPNMKLRIVEEPNPE
jgi:hypothetical protein